MATMCLIDAHSIIHRCFHAKMANLTAPSGEPTKATFGFVRILEDFLTSGGFDYCITAFDSNKATLKKKEVHPEYKENRALSDDSVVVQIKRCRKLARLMKIHCVRIDGYEADDIIGSAVKKFKSKLKKIVIVTCDKDMMQLMDSPRVLLYHPFERRILTSKDVIAKWGVPPIKVLEVMTLAGDPTDNVKGVPGVGVATAAKLILQYGSATKVQDNWKSLPAKISRAVKETRLDREAHLVSLLDVPLRRLERYAAPENVRSTKVRIALADLGFRSILKR